MENLHFYSVLNDDLVKEAGLVAGDYSFSYMVDGQEVFLKLKRKKSFVLEDDSESWKLENDGLRIRRAVTVEYPELLYGKKGIVPTGATMGVCIIWNNYSIKQIGYFFPIRQSISGDSNEFYFDHCFKPGEMTGAVSFETILFLKKAAPELKTGEESLINKTGVNIGTIDFVDINTTSLNMDFPVRDVNDKNQPLWWLELNWDDPRVDLFDENTVCLYLNGAYDYCPKIGDKIKNEELLIEIMTTVYLMIFKQIEFSGDDVLRNTIEGVGLEPGSVSMMMNYFCDSGDPIVFGPIDKMHKSIHEKVRIMLTAGDSE